MNKIITISIVVFLFKNTLLAQDTAFFLKNETQQIFINPVKCSKEYKHLVSFKFSEKDSSLFYSTAKRLKKSKKGRYNKQLYYFPKQWIEIKLFNKNYYAYYPCDFYIDYRLQITDSCFIDDFEGPVAEDILSVSKKSKTIYSFTLTHGNEHIQTKNFFIFNKKLGLAVLEDVNNKINAKKYRLLIDAKHLIDLPLIINLCPIQMEDEFKFDIPNYKEIISTCR